ncbi:hypothetical protein HGRIS_011489 [Hohenbuehelia grisea]|uniref:UDP-glucose:glycoprotein glucosyltransferase n=1 Tax=Hohenbuehelia grisea TaxID=104357 RepID=A0ABR3JV95_9AGAR
MPDSTGQMTRRTRNLLLTLLYVAASTRAASPPVEVSLRSSWPAQDSLVEIIETISLENADAFFPLVDALTGPETPHISKKTSTEAINAASLEVAASKGFLSQPGSLTSVELSLALHAAAPKIEAFYQYYDSHIARNESVKARSKTECGSWVDWYGQVVCDVETLAELAGVETIDSSEGLKSDFARPKALPFDHIHPSPARVTERPSRSAILYATIDSKNFRELHEYLYRLASTKTPHVEYIFRHAPPPARDASKRTYLSGYGVSLDLKKTDYLAVDDRQTNSGRGDAKSKEADDGEKNTQAVDPILSLIDVYPEPSKKHDPASPLSEAELENIGLQATQLIANSTEPLATLVQLSQNFPKYASALARRVVVNSSVETAVQNNAQKVQGGINVVWMNGLILDDDDARLNPLGILRLLRKERSLMQSLTSIGLSNGQAMELLTSNDIGAAHFGQEELEGMFDASDRQEGGGVITYWNDIEKDKLYESWSPGLRQLLQQNPWGFHSIKRNLFNVIFVLDFSQTLSLNFLVQRVFAIIESSFPVRFGVVPFLESEDGTKMARLINYLIHNAGRDFTMNLIKRIAQVEVPPAEQTLSVDWDKVIREYNTLVSEREDDSEALKGVDEILRDSESSAPYFDKVKAYTKRLGATPASGLKADVFVNGKHFTVAERFEVFLKDLRQEINVQTGYFQHKVQENELSDQHAGDLANYFYDLPTTGRNRNPYIYPTTTPGSLRVHNLRELFAHSGFHFDGRAFVYPEAATATPLSVLLVADLDSEHGIQLVKEALTSLSKESKARLTFVHNPSEQPSTKDERPHSSWLFSHLALTDRLSKATPARLLAALGLNAQVEGGSAQKPLAHEEISFKELTGGVSLPKLDAERYAKYVETGRLLAREVGLKSGQQALIVNGRVVGPIKGGDFTAEDFHTLEGYEIAKRVEPVQKVLASIYPDSEKLDKIPLADLITIASSVVSYVQVPDPIESGLLKARPRPRQRNYRMLEDHLTRFTFGDNSTALYQFGILLDPLSETTQKWSTLINWLANIPDIYIEVHMNPTRHKEVPLKRFYRYHLAPLSFDDDGNEIPAQITFENLPVDPIYTLAMDVSPSWLVRPRQSLYDLDNIQLNKLDREDKSLEAVFDLDYLVVEGHARDSKTNAPPRGVQVELVDNDGKPIDDTLVVANLGYVQFKAKPGVFRLQIREGRGREVYNLESVGNEGWDSPTVDQVGDEIALTSFEGLTLYPRFQRQPGMETADVLEAHQDKSKSSSVVGDVASKILSIFKQEEAKVPSPVIEQAEINIFTVASGLLYERFASIMILSVLRNTKSTVKFWFIENFLSPSFLEFIPHFAKEHGFQYELVTYKWPSWLRPQKEKQRIIWGYKILFLDVLFPMDLKKVIFVDADQIVRADLKELVDLDMKGAPYGYTPMGDDNTDMEGFRFWKTGYWRDFLQGRPYHISALYVVDLVKFRQIAAGDMLRGQYQQLSADPNSLANLDQDLPNNLQREVPIFSLHEDWLWCETWCSKDRLDRAKTIDLCQNPLTKEPKLARARQIPEWEEYDSEIAKFAQKLANDGVLHSRIAAADTRVLADAGATTDKPTEVVSPPEAQAKVEDRSATPDNSESTPARDEL